MRPVTWIDGQVQALDLPAGRTQGTAFAVRVPAGPDQDRDPRPVRRWSHGDGVAPPHHLEERRRGRLGSAGPVAARPRRGDGDAASRRPTSSCSPRAVAHRTGSSPPAYSAVVWLFDLDFTASTWDFLPSPPGTGGAGVGGWVSMRLDEVTDIWSSAAIVGSTGVSKPVVWINDVADPPFGVDFATAPWASPTGLALVGAVPYSSGWARTTTSSALPAAGRLGRGHPLHPPVRRPGEPPRRRRGASPSTSGSAFVAGETVQGRPGQRGPQARRARPLVERGPYRPRHPGRARCGAGHLRAALRLVANPSGHPEEPPRAGPIRAAPERSSRRRPSPRPGRAWPARWWRSRRRSAH